MVRRRPDFVPALRRDEGRARGGRGSCHAQSLGPHIGARGGEAVAPPTASRGPERADGRNLGEKQRERGGWVSRRRHRGPTIAFLLTPTRERDAAEACVHKALGRHGLPEKIPSDKSGSTTAAITPYKQVHKRAMLMRHSQ